MSISLNVCRLTSVVATAVLCAAVALGLSDPRPVQVSPVEPSAAAAPILPADSYGIAASGGAAAAIAVLR